MMEAPYIQRCPSDDANGMPTLLQLVGSLLCPRNWKFRISRDDQVTTEMTWRWHRTCRPRSRQIVHYVMRGVSVEILGRQRILFWNVWWAQFGGCYSGGGSLYSCVYICMFRSIGHSVLTFQIWESKIARNPVADKRERNIPSINESVEILRVRFIT